MFENDKTMMWMQDTKKENNTKNKKDGVMYAKLDNDIVKISFNYDSNLVRLVKKFSKRTYNSSTKIWSVPLKVFKEEAEDINVWEDVEDIFEMTSELKKEVLQ